MKILLLGDASNYHVTLARGLRDLGHAVTIASDGSGWMRTARDINLSRPLPGKAGGLALWLKAGAAIASGRLTGYDIVSIHNPVFLPLRPERLRPIFDRILRHNGDVYLTALGTDPVFIEECLDPRSPIAYNEWRMPDGSAAPLARECPGLLAEWQAPALAGYTDYVYSRIRGAVSVLYEYDVALRRRLQPGQIAYAGIPIDTAGIAPAGIPRDISKIRLFLGRHSYRQLEKGTDLLERAARIVAARHPQAAELVIVEDRPYAEYMQLLRSAHVVLDQIYSYTPATNALLAMAMGLNTLSGAHPDYYRFIGERELRPVISASPHLDELVDTLEAVVGDPEALHRRSAEGLQFVRKHHDARIVAQRFIDHWTK